MTIAIELDVPFDVVDEMTQGSLVVPRAGERLLKPLEHLRNDVLATVKKCGQDLFRRPRLGQRHRMRDKSSDMSRHSGPHKAPFDRSTDSRQRAERVEFAGACPAGAPSPELELPGAHTRATR